MSDNQQTEDRGNTSLRRYCFTYQLEPEEAFNMPQYHRFLRYIWQEELAPTTGQHHIQGYAEIDCSKDPATGKSRGPVKFRTIQNLMPHGTHIERARGSFAENYAYCTKTGEGGRVPGGQFGEYGSWDKANQGKRSDLIEVAKSLEADPDFHAVLKEHPTATLKYSRNMAVLHSSYHLHGKLRNSNWRIADYRWFYGPSGSGKTSGVYKVYPPDEIYSKNPTNKWWDGYDPLKHKLVLIDDYRDNKEFSYSDLLRVLDIYPLNVEVKGATIPLLADQIYVTSNLPPWDIFPVEKAPSVMDNQSKTPLVRRCMLVERQIDPEYQEDDVPVSQPSPSSPPDPEVIDLSQE